MRIFALLSVPYLALGVLATCAPTPPETGAMLFAENCAACHGADAQGAGPLAGELAQAPANLRELSASAGGQYPAVKVMEKIYGYPGRYHSGGMPEFGPLLDGPEIAWTAPDGQQIPAPAGLVALNTYLESIQDG